MRRVRKWTKAGTRFADCVRMAGTGVVLAVQLGPCAHATLPLDLPGLASPWVAIRSGGKEVKKMGGGNAPSINACEEWGVPL